MEFSNECGETITLILSADATFSDLRAAICKLHRKVQSKNAPPASSQRETALPASSPKPTALMKLIIEFLHDPDIQARWSADLSSMT